MTEIIKRLRDTNDPEWSATWSTFLFNVKAVNELGYPAKAQAIITAGEVWRGDGWTTGRASKVLYETTGVPLVSANVEDYKGSFLYALALHWGLDVASFELSERASDAAFALAAAFDWAPEGDGDGDAQQLDEDELEDGEDDPVTFPWEERQEDLPAELLTVWKRYGDKGSTRFETKHLLEQVPRYVGLPVRSVENNVLQGYEARGHVGKFDRLAKVVQQHLLNSLRVQTKLYTMLSAGPEPARALLLEHYAYTAAQVSKLDGERKEAVVPGSTTGGDGEVLFGADEYKETVGKRKLLELRKGSVGASAVKFISHPPSFGRQRQRWQGWSQRQGLGPRRPRLGPRRPYLEPWRQRKRGQRQWQRLPNPPPRQPLPRTSLSGKGWTFGF